MATPLPSLGDMDQQRGARQAQEGQCKGGDFTVGLAPREGAISPNHSVQRSLITARASWVGVHIQGLAPASRYWPGPQEADLSGPRGEGLSGRHDDQDQPSGLGFTASLQDQRVSWG